MRLSFDQQIVLRDAVRAAAAVPGLTAEVDAVYADVQRAIDLRRPRCDASGRCCRFGAYGHLLFVSTIELAVFAGRRPVTDAVDGDGCRYQVAGRCSAHAVRPFGCRIFFCDPAADDWQQEQYEAFHTRVKALHDRLGVPYLYVEWRQGLAALDAAADPTVGQKRVSQ